jgi:hypothetical protein
MIGIVDAVAKRGARYERAGKDRLYEANGQLFPRRSMPPIATARWRWGPACS